MSQALMEWRYLSEALESNPDCDRRAPPVAFHVDALRLFAQDIDSDGGDRGDELFPPKAHQVEDLWRAVAIDAVTRWLQNSHETPGPGM